MQPGRRLPGGSRVTLLERCFAAAGAWIRLRVAGKLGIAIAQEPRMIEAKQVPFADRQAQVLAQALADWQRSRSHYHSLQARRRVAIALSGTLVFSCLTLVMLAVASTL